jgi:hypothetical protein
MKLNEMLVPPDPLKPDYSVREGRTIKLKNSIPKGTIIKDLYDDGDYYFLLKGRWYPVDFNNYNHPDYCKEVYPN